MSAEFSDETLMAFADGQLDEPLFSQLALAIESDPDLAARLDALATGSALARRGFESLLAPIPHTLEDRIQRTIAYADVPPLKPAGRLNWLFPAAGFAVASVAIVVALTTLQPQQASPLAGLSSGAVAAALDTLPSGETRPLPEGIAIHAIATFTDADGHLCREFETQGETGYVAISCRSGSAWALRLAVASTPADSSFRPASGTETIEAYLHTIGASAPLLDEDEAAALAALGN